MGALMEYKGWRSLFLDQDCLTRFYSYEYLPENLKENEYLILVNEENEVIDYYKYSNGELIKVNFPVLGNGFIGKIKPRNPQQYCAMDMLKQKDIPLKLITGSFGTGKTLMCVTAALEEVLNGNFEKIIFVRNNVQVKDTDQLGALPGTALEKTMPYVMPFADHVAGIEGLESLISRGQLEVIPLAFLRGRSIRNSILYSMESENLTKEHIQLIMGRIDEGSQLWLDGDIKQRDKAAFEKSKGLETMIEKLKGHKLFGYIHLVKSERSEVARMADLLD